MSERYNSVHHFDVLSGPWIYRVFLLSSTLQVDLAFVHEPYFGARGPTFKLVFGHAHTLPAVTPNREASVGRAWLCALHARASVRREKFWQAEYFVSGMRDQVLALCCQRHGLPASEARGVDALPQAVRNGFEGAFPMNLTGAEQMRALSALVALLVREIEFVDIGLKSRLEPCLRALIEGGA
jgi:hypothetical protein